MAVSANALTLAQYAILSNDPLVQAITFSLIDNGTILEDIPIVNKKSMIANGVRFTGNLPAVNWATLNSDPVVTSGTPTPFQEQLYIIRNAIDVDRYLVQDENAISNPRAVQVAAYLKSVAYDSNDKFINNDHVTGDKNSFVGIKARIANGSVFGVRPENLIDAGGLNCAQASLSSATANAFLEFIDQLLWSVGSDDGAGVVLYMNDVMRRRFATIVRSNATPLLSITKDEYDRPIMTYRQAKIRDIGYKSDQATRIIPTVESAAGASTGGTYTSIYAAHYGEDHLFGWQFEPLVAKDINMIGNGGTVYRTLIDWAFGLYNAHTRSMARIFDIKLT